MSNMILLYEQGQSMWLDYIDRELIESGALHQLIGAGLRGMTTNPTIFQKTISNSGAYDDMIRDLVQADHEIDSTRLYEWIVIDDVKRVADILKPVYVSSQGVDGYVSVEVSPHLAYDTEATIKSVRHIWKAIDRPNIMVKVPGTKEGLPAIERLITEGININITLLFSVARYQEVADAYLRAVAMNMNPQAVASVASFFVSRIDTKVDAALDEIGTTEARRLKGKAAIANAKIAYDCFKRLFNSDTFWTQRNRGARLQRLLWGSTSTKNPAYPDVMYVNELIGPNTVNTVPLTTLDAFQVHGEVKPTLEAEVDQARLVLEDLDRVGVRFGAITDQLEKEGVQKFAESYDTLMAVLKEKMALVAQDYATHE